MVRVAAVQAASVGFDLQASIAKLQRLVAEAKENGAELVVLPEAFLSAYPRHYNVGVGYRTQDNRDWYGKYVQSAVKVPEDGVGRDWNASAPLQAPGDDFWAFQVLCETAKSNKLYLSVGIIERSLTGATVWCCNLLFSPEGVCLAKHRKIKPTGAERVIWHEADAANPVTPRGDAAAEAKAADNMPVVQTKLGKVGALICWENYMPLARYVMYKKGVELYLAPTADGRPTWVSTMQHIAMEGRCFVVSANQYQENTDMPADYPANANPSALSSDKVWCRGGSSIIGPLGDILAGPLWDTEGILYADIDVNQVLGTKVDFDPVGHYSREPLLMGLIAKL